MYQSQIRLLTHLAESLGGVASGRVRQVLGVLVLHGDVVLKEEDSNLAPFPEGTNHKRIFSE